MLLFTARIMVTNIRPFVL